MFGLFVRRRARRNLATADADALIARYGDRAYGEARERASRARQGRIVDGNRPGDHWDRVRRMIGRKTARKSVDTASRYLE